MPAVGLISKATGRDTDAALLEKLAKGIDTLAARPKMDVATFKRQIRLQAETLNKWADVFDQTADGNGKRFSGAETHEFADQLAAFSAKVRANKVPQIA